MALKRIVVALSAACTLVQVPAPAAAQISNQVPTEVPTQVSPRLSPELQTEQQARSATTKVAFEGCVERAQRDGSVGGTGLGTTSSPNTADRDANSGETLDIFLLSNARRIPPDPADGSDRTSYALEGREREMGAHTGHRVQITGSVTTPRTSGQSTSAAAAGIKRIRVEDVKMISTSCDAATVK